MKNNTIFRIGLTGGIASGKSTVSAMLRQMGATVIDTDKIAREVAKPGSAALKSMSEHFGMDILNEDGSLRRDAVGRIVFSDPEEKKWLEALLHPLIRAESEEQARRALAAGQHIVVIDVPLLFESGWHEYVDEIWTVYVPPKVQKERLRQRDNFVEQEIMDRIASQDPISEKAKRADLIIDNTGPLDSTLQQVRSAWNAVVKKVHE
ncbi:MAG TPA: dephospho-CoA kinase [Negativicutes bacterium]|nr:dephospho-CoA kinase [Negativicutes bacterium]